MGSRASMHAGALVLALLGCQGLRAAEAVKLPPSVRRPVSYSRDVEPIFHKNCYQCHGPSQQMNGLRLDQREAALRGSYSSPVIAPGHSADSRLIERVASSTEGFRMPPAGPRLSPHEIGILRGWIDQGAEWPASSPTSAAVEKGSRTSQEWHWAFRPIRQPELPAVRQRSWLRNPIDTFILARLERENIAPSPEADKITLARRLSLDLTGLLPTPDEVDQFLLDSSPEAYARLVDRLLSSAHYGEKWARQWLDLARYADSDGYEKDLPRPHAWRWRHWVIEALNRDQPFDQFTIWQIAGDLLPNATTEQKVATGFHRNSLKNREAGVKREQARYEEVVDRTNTVGTVWLGLTIGCAQCHDHKYDPITQEGYYKLFAFFNEAEDAEIDAPSPGELGPYMSERPRYYEERQALLEKNDVSRLQAAWEAKLIEAMDHPGKHVDWDDYLTGLVVMIDRVEELLRKGPQARTQRENDRITYYFIQHPGPDISKDEAQKANFKEVFKKLEELANSFHNVSQAYTLRHRPAKTYIALRGKYEARGLEVQPDAPRVLSPVPQDDRPARLRLADWLVSRDNPLTARLAVNRMWQAFFGRGIVRTPDDFGTQGEAPTHPELLDWMAAEFMQRNWSMKQMHKLIVMSASYRQSSSARPELQERDPENTLVARQNRLRLAAELIRDAALRASGLLYPAVGGRSIHPPQPTWITKVALNPAAWKVSEGRDRYRRGLYIHYQRTAPYPQLVNFDAPDSGAAVAHRNQSNTPLQALNLLNDPVFAEAAQALAVRVLQEAPLDWSGRLDFAFRLCLSRRPALPERQALAEFFERQKKVFEKEPEAAKTFAPALLTGVGIPEAASWTALGRVLINLDEFITRE